MVLLPGNCILGHISQRNETYFYAVICTSVFIVLFTMAPNWKLSKGPSIGGCDTSIHTLQYYSMVKKEQTIDICNSLDELQGSCTKWEKPVSKRYTLHDPTYRIIMKELQEMNTGSVVRDEERGRVEI